MNGTQDVSLLRNLNEINFILILVIVAGAWLLVSVIRKTMPQLANRAPIRFRHAVLSITPVLRLVIYVMVVILVIPLLIQPTQANVIAALGAAAVAIGFAFKDYVSSLVAGLVVIFERPYRPGDRVKINDAYGEVKSLGLRALKMVTPDDTTVIIPHAKIWDTEVFNANDGQRELLCVADFFVHPVHNPVEVRQKLIDTALTSPYLKIDRMVTVIVLEKPWATQYRLKAYAMDGRDEFLFISDLTVRGKTALVKMGVKPAVVPAIGLAQQ